MSKAPEAETEIIPWQPWLQAIPNDVLRPWLKSVVRMALTQVMVQYHTALAELPMTIIRKRNVVTCKANQDIPEKHMVVPLFVRRDTNMVFEDATAVTSHNAVRVKVTWVPAVAGAGASDGARTEQMTEHISVQPELKLPGKPAVAGSPLK